MSKKYTNQFKFWLLFPSLYLFFYSQISYANLLAEIERQLEERRLERLVIAKKEQSIRPFTTDGCSGGLSAGWEYLAKRFTEFESKYGQRPPWHQCCVDHDKDYWQGLTQNGFNLRQKADDQLKNCVVQTGVKLAPMLTKKLGKNEQDIIKSFHMAGELMFRAVRLGGKPCTPFPWRWGYGWPYCSFRNMGKKAGKFK